MGVFESIHYVSWAAVNAESLVSPPFNWPVLLVFEHKPERRLNTAYVARVRLCASRLVRPPLDILDELVQPKPMAIKCLRVHLVIKKSNGSGK